jgi:flagellar biosynthesis protein FlhF
MHASNSDDIKSLLNSLSQKKVVLIDTPGASEISASLKTQAEALKNASGKISVILTLSANSQNSISKKLATSLSESASGVVVTKLDEVENFGGIVSALIDSKIPLLGVSDGQKIPSDYKAISVSGFVNRCFGIIGTEIKVDSEKADLSAA